MKNIRVFLSENFQFLEITFSIYWNRCVFVRGKKSSMRMFIRVNTVYNLSNSKSLKT